MQAVYVVGKKNEKLQIVANIGKAHGCESFTLDVTKFRGFPHHWNINRRAAADVEWFPLR